MQTLEGLGNRATNRMLLDLKSEVTIRRDGFDLWKDI